VNTTANSGFQGYGATMCRELQKKRSARRAGPMDGLENFMSAKIWAINLRLKKTPVTFLVNIKIGGKMEGNLPNHSF
jgi:hypothetical protein